MFFRCDAERYKVYLFKISGEARLVTRLVFIEDVVGGALSTEDNFSSTSCYNQRFVVLEGGVRTCGGMYSTWSSDASAAFVRRERISNRGCDGDPCGSNSFRNCDKHSVLNAFLVIGDRFQWRIFYDTTIFSSYCTCRFHS